MMSSLSECLDQKQFCILVEYLCSVKSPLAVRKTLANFPAMMTLADRVHADNDPAPLDLATKYPDTVDKLIHFSGKARDIKDLERFLNDLENTTIRNLLLVTGDKLKSHDFGYEVAAQRTRYLESVSAIMAAKQRQIFKIGVAFNPFKYTEAESDAQYLKLHKKIKAGADFLITQLGFDVECLQQTQVFLQKNYPNFSALACVMPLTLKRAQFMVKNRVAGIVISDHVLQTLEKEYQSDPIQAEINVYARCALQILICKHFGYAGVHLSACHKEDEQKKLEQALKVFENFSLNECQQAWKDLWQADAQGDFKPNVKISSKPVTQTQILKYKKMHTMHRMFFESKMARTIGHFVFKPSFWNRSNAQNILLKIEHSSKHRLVGCESCGECRLGDTLYICPETCPKGLANGPCGGTSLDRCEFEDRECIHSVKARLAKKIHQTEILKTKLIPAISITTRHTSSWKSWFTDTK
ncbi:MULTISPECIES: methylenetetrahydrofolate reductase C-terminal domain-containing protein [Acinetobacter]|uniref:Methylenetetrahydrofolate reductase n=1 Tax=Acinetobacter baylyi (strain ATCC 33305 / BD413 / ADP1) TaxID=62977 RepID=Q6FBE2_ACIAD|nr:MULTISPECIES: methylenetetrahydrofolate reductase C-terminal domain-containing protein [Acinetobacter]ENV54307.1 hypothetical protein F952_01612 [Acinetobacter baylyi DSM 14961 = CIP 107474]KAF2370326.1 methylenetetrahydrofolate reductase [Acinetobacter baylyi]KAF2372706.1 methylenetetrahydrofolate reductase [Acinetobacter baylyi]KAF2378194.1 methylenetetrahydrofolate reductase [Acinetobacter baylyi]KAF2379309.1 methylenetetrahydrofolate reductase [Acinetobacter baylyi]